MPSRENFPRTLSLGPVGTHDPCPKAVPATRGILRRMSCRVSALGLRSFGLWLLFSAACAGPPAGQAETARLGASEPPPAAPEGVPVAAPVAEEVRSGSVVLRWSPGTPRRAELADLAAHLDRALGAMAARLPYAGNLAFEIAVEPDYSAQARTHGAVGEAVEGRGADLALVFDPADREAYRFALAHRLLARAGISSLPPGIADGAALWLSEGWYGRTAEGWLGPLARAGGFPAAAELLAPKRPEDGSRLLATPVAAAWIERRPGRTLAEKLGGGLPSAEALDGQLAAMSTTAAKEERADRSGNAGSSGSSGSRGIAGDRFLRGVSFAMLNSVDGGYHAPSVDREYDRLGRLGADAVSLMPFAYQRDPKAPGLAFLDDHPSAETDIGLLHAARRAHARGLAVLWKPHLWVGHHSWPGEVEMRDEASWKEWWSGYRRYVLHHALLAAWGKAEIFCVGVELDRTAIGPKAPHGERAWRELIAAVRVLYPGAVTYAANWDRADEVPFWDALDFAGVDAYYPLAASEQATDAELAAGARQVAGRLARLAQRARRPLLLTEVGFAARRFAWREPHSEVGEVDEQDQLRAYRALLPALGRRPWLAGVFLWKSFSDEDAVAKRRAGRADFRFLGRRAEEAVGEYFALGASRTVLPPSAAPLSKGTP